MPQRFLRLRSIWPALFTFACCLLLYLAYAASAGPRELVAAFLIAAVSTLATFIFSTAGRVRFHLRWCDLIQAWRIPGYLLLDTATVLRALARQLFSRRGAPSLLASAHFPVGSDRSPHDAARRALATGLTSATPNSIVLGFDRPRRLIILHQLLPAPIPQLTRNLGATS